MGLDMYLCKNYYVKNWNFMGDEERHSVSVLKGGKPSGIATDRIVSVTTEEACWRKANAIHRWFVENIQDGKDDCGKYYVNEKQLAKLLGVVKAVLADHNKAKELLPTQEGFFFGDTSFDEYYFEDLEYTQKELERILATKDEGSLEYHSSW